MSIQTTINELKAMRLLGLLEAFEAQMQQPNAFDNLSFEERVAMLIDRESLFRSNKRLSKLLRNAKFKLQASIKNIDYQHPRGLDKSKLSSMLSGEWLARKQNLLVTGPTGSGKTYLACAIGRHVCTQGRIVRYYRSARFFESLTIAHGDGSYPKLIKALSKVELLIIDDWGLDQLMPSQRTDLLEIMEDRHEVSSTLITSQRPTIHWHEAIGDPTLADAILDRLLHNAHKFNLKGDSMRKIKNNLTEVDQRGTVNGVSKW